MNAIKKSIRVVFLLFLIVAVSVANLASVNGNILPYASDDLEFAKTSLDGDVCAATECGLPDVESDKSFSGCDELQEQSNLSSLTRSEIDCDLCDLNTLGNKAACSTIINNQNCDISDAINGLFSSSAAAEKIDEQVYLGGYAIGMTIDGDGVTVIGLNEFFGEDGGLCCPSLLAGLQINDVIVGLNGKKVYSSARLSELVGQSNGNKIDVDYIRDGVQCSTTIVPQRDLKAGQYRIGLWTRDSSSGIGTITYVRKNLKFGSLGHAIVDPKGAMVNCKNGGVFECNILGVERGVKGTAGELKGAISFDSKLGSLYANNKFGAFGTFDTLPSFCNRLISVADISEVSPGKAEIYCSPDGRTEAYRIDIVKAAYQAGKEDRGLVIHVVDDRLIDKTGGIVQGMSGSPIVQNGKLVGAVTHVFVNDPTRGYGIYAKWMLTN